MRTLIASIFIHCRYKHTARKRFLLLDIKLNKANFKTIFIQRFLGFFFLHFDKILDLSHTYVFCTKSGFEIMDIPKLSSSLQEVPKESNLKSALLGCYAA